MDLPPELAAKVALVVLDVDGVLTDGGIYVGVDSEGRPLDLRRFHVHDGLGVYLLRTAGLRVAAVSGKVSPAVRARMAELGIREAHQVHPFGKVAAVEGILRRTGLGWDRTACLADDVTDLAVLEKAALPAAVANAVPEVKEKAVWVGSVRGGSGAVREFAEALLRGRGVWNRVMDGYLEACRRGGKEGPEAAEDADREDR